MSDLERGPQASLTQQIVDILAAAIDSGELAPGDRLPATRELAELAGINHLTAARAYRRLAERGLVAGKVGSGTFVRATAAAPSEAAGSPLEEEGRDAWQVYALPDAAESYGDRVLAEMFVHAGAEDVLPLSVGYLGADAMPLESIREHSRAVLAEEGHRALQYMDIEGVPELREGLAELLVEHGMRERPENIVVTSGARQGLTLVARAVLRPGDLVACESPSFIAVIESLREAGARVLPVPSDENGLDTEVLEQLVRRHEIRLLAIQPRLHNPTGRDLSPERREHLVELARRYGFFVLEDGVYSDLRVEGEPQSALRADCPDHVIYVDSFSKSVGGGLRAGWVAASGPVLERIVREKRNDDMHSASLTQLILARFLAAGDYGKQLERVIPFYRERRDALIAAVERELAPVATAVHPLGGGHLWVTLRSALDERALYREAATRFGVTFLPGGAMMPDRPQQTHMRLSYGMLAPQQLDEGVRRLGVAIRAARREERPARGAAPIA